MTVLRSSKVVSATQKEHSPNSTVEIEPSTPAKEVEVTNKSSSYETTPNSGKMVQSSEKLGSGGSTNLGSNSSQGLRRSARLSLSGRSSYNAVEIVSSRRKRKAVNCKNGEGSSVADCLDLNVTEGIEKESGGFETVVSNVRVSMELDTPSSCEVNGSESVDAGNKCLKLRSGKKLVKPGINHAAAADDDNKLSAHKDEKETDKIEGETDINRVSVTGVTIEAEGGLKSKECDREKPWMKFSREDKQKGVSVENEEMEINCSNDVNGNIERGTSRFNILEKGKGKVVMGDSSSDSSDTDDSSSNSSVADGKTVDTLKQEQAVIEGAGTSIRNQIILDYKNRFKIAARENASKFAHFSVEEELKEDPHADDDDDDNKFPQTEANGDVEDWPGPFSTAMKIIRDRAANMSAQQKHTTSNKTQSVPLTWVPKEKQSRGRLAPLLQDLCMKIMAENVDAISSLESVPDVLRHKLTQLLCDSRKMNHHFLELLASGSPSELRVRDCSWLSEEQLTKIFEMADTSKLTVLQLDQCGRCLPDYVLLSLLGQLPNKLSALTNISLKGACRLSDGGLNALVSAAPALRSINLGCCSLLTSNGIINLAEKLGPYLKELYLDECFDVDAKCILPALMKLQQLEVLSVSHLETVTDSFIIKFVAARGQNMRELVLEDCTKLTDRALKAIAESCPELCVIDLTRLCKLTDNALGYLANGCQKIQTMKLCRNTFSDEAVAAYLEASGKPLKELSLNHVDKVSHHTALSLAKHAKNLRSLDLSWCRDMTNEALGLIVDSCLSLKTLKLFGCTQVTNVFMDGHSNEEVRITGLKESQILNNIELPDLLPLRYSAV